MSGMKKLSKAKFHDPPNVLRQKVGYGGIDPERIAKAEDYIQTNKADFIPYAEKIAVKLGAAIKKARAGKQDDKVAIEVVIRIIMELKANGGMFRYMLMSEIAGIMLNFLENIPSLNEDVFEIMDANYDALNVIIKNRLSGSGGHEGRALADELYKACQRYYTKHEIEVLG
jgi:hypothetical protein